MLTLWHGQDRAPQAQILQNHIKEDFPGEIKRITTEEGCGILWRVPNMVMAEN